MGKRMNKKYAARDAKAEQARALREEGKTQREIAEILKCSVTSVAGYAWGRQRHEEKPVVRLPVYDLPEYGYVSYTG